MRSYKFRFLNFKIYYLLILEILIFLLILEFIYKEVQLYNINSI